MRIAVLVSHLMMTPVNRRPTSWATLQRRRTPPGQYSSQPTRRNKTPMREQAMIAYADRKSCDQIETDEKDEIDWPRPEPKSEQTKCVQRDNKEAVRPVKSG